MTNNITKKHNQNKTRKNIRRRRKNKSGGGSQKKPKVINHMLDIEMLNLQFLRKN